MFEVNTVILEGPDLSGKTTLYNKLHKISGYRWNIQDRSTLSMVCFARQFNRSDKSLRKNLEKELCNLNNKLVVLMPSFDTIKKRYEERGDEIQTLESLRDLYKIFNEEISLIKDLPNVFVIRESKVSVVGITRQVFDFLEGHESKTPAMIGDDISKFLRNAVKNEYVIDLSFSGKIKKDEDPPADILKDEREGHYYTEILWEFENIIKKELAGINPYNQPQDMSSRRFYYSSDSCISSIHFMPRNDILRCCVCFRSTDSVKNADIDLSFVDYLIHKLGGKYFYNCNTHDTMIRMNSAHIRDRI